MGGAGALFATSRFCAAWLLCRARDMRLPTRLHMLPTGAANGSSQGQPRTYFRFLICIFSVSLSVKFAENRTLPLTRLSRVNGITYVRAKR